MGQTVNLLVFTFGGSNPSSPTKSPTHTDRAFTLKSGVFAQVESNGNSFALPRRSRKNRDFEGNCGSSSVGRASAFQAEGRGFEPRLPLQLRQCSSGVERFLGKEEVASSILATGSAFFVVYIL